MQVFIDSACFPDLRDPAREALQAICEENDLGLFIHELSARGAVGYRNEVVALAGLGVAALSLVVALLQLAASQRGPITEAELSAQVDAFLKLRGIPDYRIAGAAGVENLTARNGKPAAVLVCLPGGATVTLHVGLTAGRVLISPIEYDWRALT